MAAAFNDPERTQSASATCATRAADEGIPPAGQQAVDYALWLKQWFERNNTVEERLVRLLLMKLEPEELGFVLYLSACITFTTAFTLVIAGRQKQRRLSGPRGARPPAVPKIG